MRILMPHGNANVTWEFCKCEFFVLLHHITHKSMNALTITITIFIYRILVLHTRLIIALIRIMRRPSFCQMEMERTEAGAGVRGTSGSTDQKYLQQSAMGASGSSIRALVSQKTNATFGSNSRLKSELPPHPNCLAINDRRRREYLLVLVTLLLIVGIYVLCFAPRLATHVLWELVQLGVNIDIELVLIVSRLGDFGQPLSAIATFLIHVAANRRYRRLLRGYFDGALCARNCIRKPNRREAQHPATPQILEPWHFANQALADVETRNPYEDFANIRRVVGSHALITFRRIGAEDEDGCLCLLRVARLLVSQVRELWRRCRCCCRRKSNPFANHWANDPAFDTPRSVRLIGEAQIYCNNRSGRSPNHNHLGTQKALECHTQRHIMAHNQHQNLTGGVATSSKNVRGTRLGLHTSFQSARPHHVALPLCQPQSKGAEFGLGTSALRLHFRRGLDSAAGGSQDRIDDCLAARVSVGEQWPVCECWASFRCAHCKRRDNEISLLGRTASARNRLSSHYSPIADPVSSTSCSAVGECVQELEMVPLQKTSIPTLSSTSLGSCARAPDSPCKRVVSDCHEQSKMFVWNGNSHSNSQESYHHARDTRHRLRDSAAATSYSHSQAISPQIPPQAPQFHCNAGKTRDGREARGPQSTSGSQSRTLTSGSVCGAASNCISSRQQLEKKQQQLRCASADANEQLQEGEIDAANRWSPISQNKGSQINKVEERAEESSRTAGSSLSNSIPLIALASAQTATNSQTDSENIAQ